MASFAGIDPLEGELGKQFPYILDKTRDYERQHPSFGIKQVVNGLYPDLKRKLADGMVHWESDYDKQLESLIEEAYWDLLD